MDANAPRRGGSGSARSRALVIGAAVIVLVAVVAIASSGSAPSGGIAGRRPSEGLMDTVFSLFLVLMGLCAILVVVLLSFFGRYTPEGALRKRRSPIHSVLSFLLAIVVLALFVRGLTGSRGDRDGLLGLGRNGDGASGSDPNAGYDPQFAVWPVVGLTALVAVAVGAWWLTVRGHRSVRQPLPATPQEALADVLAATLDDLRAEGDPRRAVIGAYARMERSLAAVGLPRGDAEAPEEYLERVLDAVAVSGRAAGRLTALFAWARFSVHDVRPEMKDDAIETLEQVQQELAAEETEREARLAGALT